MKICALIADPEQNTVPGTLLLHRILFQLYYDYGIRRLIIGIQLGAELESLSFFIKHKRNYPGLTVDGVFSHEEEAKYWPETEREKLYRLISQCDRELVLKPVFENEREFQRNIVMMDMADIILLLGKNKDLEFWARKITGAVLKVNQEKEILIPPLSLYPRQYDE